MNSITISIPAYNDEKTILNVITESKNVISELVKDYEIVVINDGSQDSTGKILDNIKNNNIKVFHHSKNEGFGRTIKEIFTLPSKEWVFFIPGDGQISPEELKKFYPSCCDYDFTLGWRKNRQDLYIRRLGSSVYNFIISLISFNHIHDVNSVAFFRREIMNHITINSKGAFVHAEVYLKLLKNNYRIKEIGVVHNPRISGKSGALRLKVIVSAIKDLLLHILGRL
ncbi:MAG: hypothetical protein C0412_21090 [Flavobacterium sp.]|nr:hypothetical protein [Flavobacterium sp.]